MLPFRLTTKRFTIEIFRRGIVFTVASVLLASGVSLCNKDLVVALVSVFNNQAVSSNCNDYSLFVGLFLILVSLFLFYLLIVNWRKEIYSETFIHIRKAVDAYGNSWNARIRGADSKKLRPLHQKAYDQYIESLDFIRNNQAILDIPTYDKAWDLLYLVVQEIIQLDDYIKALDENDPCISFDPQESNEEAESETKKISGLYKEFVALITEKEKYRFK